LTTITLISGDFRRNAVQVCRSCPEHGNFREEERTYVRTIENVSRIRRIDVGNTTSAGPANANVLLAVRVVHRRFQFRVRSLQHRRRVLRSVHVEYVLRVHHVDRRPLYRVRANVTGPVHVGQHGVREQ